MGNIFSSSDKGRKLNPFSLKMAEGAFVKKIGAPSGAISAALYFGTLPPVATLKALFKERLLSFDTYSSVCRNGRWVAPAGGVDVDKHLIQATVRSEAEMHAYCEAEMMKPLTNGTDAPLWECHLVTNTARGQRSMLFFRVEHALGDGIALNQVLSQLATDAAGQALPPASYARPPRKPRGICGLILDAIRSICKYLSAPVGPYDSDTPLVQPRAARSALPFGLRRKAVLVPTHSLNTIKRIKNAASAASAPASFTVNDVVFAATAGALRRYCLALAPAETMDAVRVRALTPLAFPRAADAPLDNKWCFLDVPMPCSLPSPTARLKATHETFNAMKNGPEAPIAKFFTDQNCGAPNFMFAHTAQQVMQRYSIVASNVPGPAAPVYVCGQKLLGLQAFYPNLIMQQLCVSYDSLMHMNFVVDPDVIIKYETLPTLYLDELRALAVHYGVDPDDTSPPPPMPTPSAAKPKGGATEMV